MNGWSITTVNAAGATSSEATVVARNSPWMIVHPIIDAGSTNYSIQLPTSPVTGDLVEVCVDSTSNGASTVWLGTTVINSSTTHFESVPTGTCRPYRFISGSYWNRYD